MAIYRITERELQPLSETKFGAAGLYERQDLQRLLKEQITVLGRDLLVIAEEWSNWADSGRRIDLLCLSNDASLVVVELKRTDDGGHMELQAIRYAAMISHMKFGQMVDAFADYKGFSDGRDQARQELLDFLDWAEEDENEFPRDVRIILAAADFSKEITTAVLWLNSRDLDITCMRMKPYAMADGTILVDVQQVVPLPEAAEYTTQIRAKEQAERANKMERHSLREQFWAQLLSYAKTKTELHATRRANIHGHMGVSMQRGLMLEYVIGKEDSRVEVAIDFGQGSDSKNLQFFNALKGNQPEIEQGFGSELSWQDLPGKRACYIRKVIAGGYRTPTSDWPRLHERMVEAMIRLDAAVRPYARQVTLGVETASPAFATTVI